MAMIRSYTQPQVEPRGIPGVGIPGAPVGAFGNAMQTAGDANALMQASGYTGQAANTLDRIVERERDEADGAYVDQQSIAYQSERRKLLLTGPNAFYSLKGEAAIKGLEPTTKALDELRTGILATANNDRQRRELTKRLGYFTSEAEEGMARHVSTQSLVWQDSVAKGKVRNALDEAAVSYNDQAKVTVQLQGAADTEYARVLKETSSPDAAQSAARAVTSNGYKSVIQLMAVEDPIKAQRFLDANRDKIDASDAPGLTAAVKEAVTTRNAQNITNTVSATGGVSPNYNARVVGAEGGNPTVENKIGALGKYQMIPSTYTSLGQETEWGKGKSQAEIRQMLLDPKDGPARQDELQGRYNDRSAKALQGKGVPVNDLTLYTTHFLGQGAGPEILKLPDDTPLQAGLLKAHGGDAAFVQKVNDANPFLAKVETVGDLKALMAQKIGAPRSLAATGSPEKPNLDAMLSSGLVMAGDDPDLRDKATSMIKTRYAEKYAVYTQQIGALEKQAFAHIDAGGDTGTLPPNVRAGLDADSLTKVQAYEVKVLEKRRKEKAEEAGKALTDLEGLGQLQVEDVEKARNSLTASEYRSWQKIARGDDRADDANTYERLQRGMGTRDMRDDIFAAHNAGEISNQTRNSFLEKNSTFLKEGAPSSPYKLGHDYVTRALDPGLMGAGISRQTAASGIKEYDQYVATNPQREQETTDQYSKRLDQFAQDTVKRWSLINTQEMGVSLPVPANTTLDRASMSGLPKPEAQKQISRAYQDLQKAFSEQRITQDQLDADAIALMKWLDFVQKRPDAPAPAPAKR